jgi:hypothetical protein
MLLDDLGRVLATPMPRSRALRLLGATLFCAIFPRSAAAYNCSQQTCTQPIKCCLDFPGNPNASTPAACCTSNQFCCKGVTPMGGSRGYDFRERQGSDAIRSSEAPRVLAQRRVSRIGGGRR